MSKWAAADRSDACLNTELESFLLSDLLRLCSFIHDLKPFFLLFSMYFFFIKSTFYSSKCI